MNSKRRKTHSSFREEWLTNSKYKLWVSTHFLKPYTKEKEQTLDELNGIHKRLENEYKQIV